MSKRKDKEQDENSTVTWTYSGEEEEWDSFDRGMVRFMRKKLDDFGEKLWMGEVPVVETLTYNSNEFAEYCIDVYHAISVNDHRLALSLFKKGSDFWKKGWQVRWVKRQLQLMIDHIEDHAKGQVEIEIVNFEGDKRNIRQHLYEQFGSGSGGDIHSQELEYEKGMPDKDGVAFKPGSDITVKLRQLEGRKIYFWKMCLPSKRSTYVFCQESKLVRIVLEHINDDYKGCIDRLLDYVKLQKLIEVASKAKKKLSSTQPRLSSLDRSFNNDWLPSWKELQSNLIDEYKKFIKDGKFPCGKSAKASEKLPVAVGAIHEIVCYACGTKGHKSGDPSCKAGPYDVAPCAPKEFKDRKDAKKRKASNGGAQQGEFKKTKVQGAKKPCFDFAKGNCRRGAACRFSHDEKDKEKKSNGQGKGKLFSPQQKKAINVMLASAVKKKLLAVAKANKKDKKEKADDEDADFAAAIAPFLLAPCVNMIPRNPVSKGSVILVANLHNVHKTCGIDSDAGMSISTLEDDFIWLDKTPSTVNSLAAPAGINGGTSVIGGIGPMIIKAHSGEFIIDPNGVYLQGSEGQPNFRVLATQRLKALGVRVVGCYNGTEDDVIQDRRTKKTIRLNEEGQPNRSILVLHTTKVNKLPITNSLKKLVKDIQTGNKTAMVIGLSDADLSCVCAPVVTSTQASALTNYFEKQASVMVFNIAKCSAEERSRLFVRRLGYCDSNLLVRMNKDPDFGELPSFCSLNEDNPVKDAAKYRKLTHERTDPSLSQRFSCWGRTYVDGYGGGKSMGEVSYEGAIGGYLFKCPSTGETHHKLYASHEQFPSAVFQFLTHVEGEGNRCHELYVDTFSVNISAELEEVVGLFQCKIVPISAGTPQELAFVETAHRVIAGRSRAMLIGAPHLPGWCWALADKHAAYVGRFLPQSTRQWKCSYFLNTKRAPDWRNLCIHVFGAPCRFAPMEGPIHKRAEMTEEGYYVGVQHPMVLIIRKRDMKLISCSKKKFAVYESAYIGPLSYSPHDLGAEINNMSSDGMMLENLVQATDKFEAATALEPEAARPLTQKSDKTQTSFGPVHVQSIKSMSLHTVPVPNTSAPTMMRPPTTLDASADSQNPDQGEGLVVPEHITYVNDLASGIEKLTKKAKSLLIEPRIREKVIKSLEAAKKSAGGEIEPRQLRKGLQKNNEVNADNIVNAKRNKEGQLKFQVGDGVSVRAELFDGKRPGSFSKLNPERQLGVVVNLCQEQGKVEVEFLDGLKYKIDVKQVRLEKPKVTALLILSVMLADLKKADDPMDKSKWPKNFFEAIIRPDWRSWVEAVKKEIASWLTFDAYTEIPFASKTPGASIVPLGELYTRKRDLSHKFRQYLMGNLLRKGKDFDETFSCCISWDGIRWSVSVACAMSKEIRGLDAITGFLQAREQFDLYAFLPSHGNYSSLSYEELAILRMKLLELVQKEGMEGLRKFAAAHKRESRVNPKTCYRLNSSIYGAPSANHEWDMLFQSAHTNDCGLTISDVEPSLYVRIEVDENDVVKEWMIANIWTDDVRYFGTDDLLQRYEKNIQKSIKVKLLGVPGEFVGTEIIQDLKLGLCELKAPKYWEGAAQKFEKYFKNGIKERHNPLTIIDEKFMLNEEVSDEEVEEARNLPYRELLGVISYPASCTKLEMRYAVSICGKHRGRWGKKQFQIVMKAFEYGFTTRHTGLIYSKGLDKHGINVLSCHADSGHSLPRSYGCTIVFLNGAAISLSANNHTLTGSATCHDEIIEFSIAGNKVVGYRNMMEEMHLAQDKPTVIYQDNEAAIMIEKNRGSLSGQSRHIERKVLTCRNKVEDGQIFPVYLETSMMAADIGTKALGDKQFAYLRDLLTGYSLVKAHHPAYNLPPYIV